MEGERTGSSDSTSILGVVRLDSLALLAKDVDESLSESLREFGVLLP